MSRHYNESGYAMTLEEIGRHTGQSKKAVAMMISHALQKIRARDGSLEQFAQVVELRRAVMERRTVL